METCVFIVKWQSSVTPSFLTESDKRTDELPTVTESGKERQRERERPALSTRGYDHCFSLVVI